MAGVAAARRRRATRPTCRSCTASTAPGGCPELELPWLAGYEGSDAGADRATRAAEQLQLDVWGEVLDGLSLDPRRAAGHARRRLGPAGRPDGAPRGRLAAARTTGSGRCAGPRRHFTHSKVMAWVAADRMVTRRRGTSACPGRWTAGRSCATPSTPTSWRTGSTPSRNTFVQSYGGTELDASLLLIPRVGFLPAGRPARGRHHRRDPARADRGRVRAPLPHRRTADDGLPGGEGVFLACSFWLVDALHGGRPARRGHAAVRAAAGAAQRRRAAQRGVGPRRRAAARQHPAGLQPLRARSSARSAAAHPPAPSQRREAPLRRPPAWAVPRPGRSINGGNQSPSPVESRHRGSSSHRALESGPGPRGTADQRRCPLPGAGGPAVPRTRTGTLS